MELKIDEILSVLPHRYPFLLVDRILTMEPDRVVGLKNVTINEPHFTGHFPGSPIMPGVLILEAMAQVGGCMMYNLQDEMKDRLIYFLGIDKARFRRMVVPGDQLIMEVRLLKRRGDTAKLSAEARVDGEVAAQAEFLSMVGKKG